MLPGGSVILSSFPYDRGIGSIREAKTTSDLRNVVILDNEGSLFHVIINGEGGRVVEVRTNVLGFEWYESKCQKLAVLTQEDVSFYSLELQRSSCGTGDKQLSSLKCTHKILFDDLIKLMKSKNWVGQECKRPEMVKILHYAENLCTVFVNCCIATFQVSSSCVTLQTIFQINIQTDTNLKFVQVTESFIFSLIPMPGLLYVYNLKNGMQLCKISLLSCLQKHWPNHCLRLNNGMLFSISHNLGHLVLIDDEKNAYCFSLKKLLPSVDVTIQNNVDSESVNSIESSTLTVSDKIDSISLSGNVSQFSDNYSQQHKKSIPGISNAHVSPSLTPFWVDTKQRATKRLSGFNESASGYASNIRSSEFCNRLCITGTGGLHALNVDSVTATIWEMSNSDHGGLLILDLKTGTFRSNFRFQEQTYAILNSKCNLPHLLLTQNHISAFANFQTQEEIVSKFMLYENAAAADCLARINNWECISMPINVLELGLKNYQLDAISFFLNSQDDDMNTGEKDTLMEINHFKTIMELLRSTIKESLVELGSRSFSEQLLQITLDYLNRVLRKTISSVCQDSKTSHEFALIRAQIGEMALKYLIELRKYLKDFPKLGIAEQTTEDFSASLLHQLEEFPILSHTWKSWSGLEVKDVICDAVQNRCLPLAETYCIKNNLIDSSLNFFNFCLNIVSQYVIELLNAGDLEHAVIMLRNFGLNSDMQLKKIFFKTASRRLHRLLEEKLKCHKVISRFDEKTIYFFHLVESIYSCQSFKKAKQNLYLIDNDKSEVNEVFSSFPTESVNQAQQNALIPFGEILISDFENWESMDYSCLTLEWTQTWCQETWFRIIMEGLFHKEDSRLQDLISSDVTWLYLLQHNHLQYLLKLVNQEYSVEKHAKGCTSTWSISSKMLNDVKNYAPPSTAGLLLNQIARYGVIPLQELEETSLGNVIRRFRLISTNELLMNILSLPSASLTLFEFHTKMIALCKKNFLAHVLYYYAEEFQIPNDLMMINESFEFSWPTMLAQFRNWAQASTNYDVVVQASLSNAEFKLQHSCDSVEMLLSSGNVIIALATLLYLPCSLKMTCSKSENSEGSQWKVRKDVLILWLDSEPILKASFLQYVLNQGLLLPLQDITVYDLLQDRIPFDLSHLFGWQTTKSLKASDVGVDMPYFAHPELVKQHGHVQDLNFTFYLMQGRPTFAYAKFVGQCIQESNAISTKRIRDACNQTHLIAIQNFHSLPISTSCVAFMEMLSWNTQGLRIDLEVSQILLDHRKLQLPENLTLQKRESKEKENQMEIALLLRRAVCGQRAALMQLLSSLEEAIIEKINLFAVKGASVEACCKWSLIMMFCQRYSLAYPTTFLKLCMQSDDWIMFAFFAEIHKYPKSQILELVSQHQDKQMMIHLMNAFKQLRYVNSKTVSLLKETRSKPKDVRAKLYSKIGMRSSRKGELKKDIIESKTIKATSDDDSRTSTAGSSDDFTDNSASSIPSLETLDILARDIPSDLLGVLLYCHQKSAPWVSLLNCAAVLRNPVLVIIAACYQQSLPLECLCVWLLTSFKSREFEKYIPSKGTISVSHWDPEILKNIIVESLRMGHLPTLTEGFYFFMPDSPIYSLLRFVKGFLLEKLYDTSIIFLKEFHTGVRNVHDSVDGIGSKQWLAEVAVLITNECVLNISNAYERIRFLKVLCEQSFGDALQNSNFIPDYTRLLNVQELLANNDVTFNLHHLLKEKTHLEHVEECRMILHSLLKSQLFPCAYAFAEITELPKSIVIISQIHDELSVQKDFKEGNNLHTKFAIWKHCLSAFIESGVPVDVIYKFCKDYGMQISKERERYFVLSLAWLVAISAPKISDALECDEEFEREMWMSRIKAELESENNPGDINEIANELDYFKKILITNPVVHKTSKMIMRSVGLLSENTLPLNNEKEKAILEKIIGHELDKGNIDIAYRLSVLFKQKCTSLTIILTCMRLAEGVMALHHIDVDIRLLLERGSVIKPRKLSTRSLNRSFERSSSSFSSSMVTTDAFSNVPTKESPFLSVPSAEMPVQNDTLTAMEKLLDHCELGVMCCSKIITLYKIADVLDLNYIDIVNEWGDIKLLKVLLQSEHADKYILAKDYILSNNMDDTTIATFLCEHILCAIRMITGNATDEDHFLRSSSELIVKPNDTSATFIQLSRLCKDPSILGSQLLQITEIKCNEKANLSLAVELCIRAHCCFTIACHVEGITRSLQKAKKLSSKLTKAAEFQLMICLLTGIGRFSEMTYIFDILRESHQFELLFRKGMEKIPDLKMALLDYLRRFHPVDTETFTMVALHFSMYREIAEMLETAAKRQIASLKLISSDHQSKYHETLENVLQFLADAAESYAKAECMQHAILCSKQAELVALQIFLQATGMEILNLDASQVSDFIANHPNVLEASIVAEAYSQHQDWPLALYNNFVLKNDANYLKDFICTGRLIPSTIEEIARRYKKEPVKNSKISSNMSQLLDLVEDVQLKYELANSVGFHDVAMDMLRGENASLLQDSMQNRKC